MLNIRQILYAAIVINSCCLLLMIGYKTSEKQAVPISPPQQIQSLPQPPVVEPPSSFFPISFEGIEQDIRYLTSPELRGRFTGQPGNIKAVEYISQQFKSLGLKVKVQPFNLIVGITKVVSYNVIAWIPGNTNDREVVVIGAHLDAIGDGKLTQFRGNEVCLGADDNASGCGALLAVARAFAAMKDKVNRTVTFQAYNGEELGLKGSLHYCKNPLLPEQSPSIKAHIFMVNLDMIGYLKQEKYAVLQDELNIIDVDALVQSLNPKYAFATLITNRGGGSDHASFYNSGIPVAFLSTGLHRNYHTVRDTPEKLDYKGIAQIANYCYDLSSLVVGSTNRPQLQTGFKPLPTETDHGKGELFK